MVIVSRPGDPLNDEIHAKCMFSRVFPYLEKIFDSNLEGYEEFKVKVFEINFEKYRSLHPFNLKGK